MSDDAATHGEANLPDLSAVLPTSSLLAHAQKSWSNLTAGERLLLHAATLGDIARFPGDPEEGGDPEASELWTEDRTIRADLLRWLFVDPEAAGCIDARGVQLRAARIVGSLDLSFLDLCFPLRLWRCVTTEDIILAYTTARLVSLRGCSVRALIAPGLTVRGNLTFDHLKTEGGVNLLGAQISGNLHADGCCLRATDDRPALNLESAHINGSVLLRRDWGFNDDRRDRVRTGRVFHASGAVRLFSCHIGDNLECDGATFTNPGKSALEGSRVRVGGHILLRSGFSSDGEIDLYSAHIGGSFNADGGMLDAGPDGRALILDGAHVEGSVLLRRQWRRRDGYRGAHIGRMFQAVGQVDLFSCRIDHNLICYSAKFSASSNIALRGSRVRVSGDVILSRCTFEGGADLIDGQIGGNLRADGSTFNAMLQSALSLEGAHIGGEVSLIRDWHTQDDRRGGVRTGRRFRAVGGIRLTSCTIGRGLWCRGSTLTNRHGSALAAFRLKVGGPVDLSNCTSQGAIVLDYASISGDLTAKGSAFNGEMARLAFSLWGGHVEGNMLFTPERNIRAHLTDRGRFRASGAVILSYSRITGNLDYDDALLSNPGLVAMDGSWLKVGGNVHLRNGFSSQGTVRLRGIRVEGELDCRRGVFNTGFIGSNGADTDDRISYDDSREYALDASYSLISNNVWLEESIIGMGWVQFYAAKVNGDLSMWKLHLPEYTTAGVNLVRSVVQGVFLWTGIDMQRSPSARLLLDHAELGRLRDDAGGWPQKGRLSLAGLRYTAIGHGPQDAERRVEWLRRQDPSTFSLQPYEQFAAVLRSSGQESAARRVAIARENARRQQEGLKIVHALRRSAAAFKLLASRRRMVDPETLNNLPAKVSSEAPRGMSLRAWIGSQLLRATIGYGYATGRVLIWLSFFVGIGWIVLQTAHEANPCVFVSADLPAGAAPPTCDPINGSHGVAKGRQTFNAFAYSVDSFLPVGDLHQESRWLPDTGVSCELYGRSYPCGRLLRGYLWLQNVAGWMLTTLAIAGLTGLIRKT
ncbi:MAG TPA: hypothetical protein VF615_30190 [Longimicrobiaceae bacterium]|jgi:hypothetical protein